MRECERRRSGRVVLTDGGSSVFEEEPVPPQGEQARAVPVTEAVKQQAMDAAPVGITLTDPSLPDNPLVYVNDAYERITGYRREEVIGRNCRLLQGPDTREAPVAKMRAAVAQAEPVTVTLRNYRKDGELFWNRVELAPLFDDDGEVAFFVGFQLDVTRRKHAERAARERARAYRDERMALEAVLDRVDGLLADVSATVVQASTREELQAQVCRCVAGTPEYAFAWVGEYGLSDETVDPVVGFGGEAGAPRRVDDVSLSFDDDDPVVAAVASNALQLRDASECADGRLHGPEWPDRYGSVAVVPLSYGDVTYGVLAVYADEEGAFDEHERVVLASVGRTVATAINAVESHERVVADDVAEARLDVSGSELFPVVLAAGRECEVAFAGAEVADGEVSVLWDVSGVDAAVALETAAAFPGLSTSVVVDGEDGCLVSVTGSTGELVEGLAARGVEVASFSADADGASLVLSIPAGCDGRDVVSTVQARFPGATLEAYRSGERSVRTRREFAAALDADLTDRQRAALVRAHAAGFFETPRAVSGETLAASMGVSTSTFHEHLRAALGKVVGEVVDGIAPTDGPI
jgi:PAS domain S-box-containing protein